MAAAASLPLISVEEYLRSSYEPDVDYVDGLVEERHPGEIDHGLLQRRLLLMLCSISAALEERVFPETRVQVAPTRFRIPDDFFAMGVPEIWIFDPEERNAYRLLPGAFLQEAHGRSELAGTEISLDLDRLFRAS